MHPAPICQNRVGIEKYETTGLARLRTIKLIRDININVDILMVSVRTPSKRPRVAPVNQTITGNKR